MEIVVIGGGIVGASIADSLSKASDASIVVCEKNEAVISETTSWSTATYKMIGNVTQREMRRDGYRTYNEFLANPRAETWYDLIGQLVVATTEAGADTLRGTGAEDERKPLSPDVYLDGDEIAASMMVPWLDIDAVVGGRFRPNVAFFEPAELAREFVIRARERGVEFRTGTAVREVVTADGAVVGVETSDGRIEADEVVCAAGPWNGPLAATAGVDLPLRQTVAMALEVAADRQATTVQPKLNHRETGSGFRGSRGPTDLVYRTGPTGNPAEYYIEGEERDPDEPIPEADDIRRELLDTVRTLLPPLRDASVVDQRVGLLSRTPDGLPIVGATEVGGFSVAALHANGIQLAPAIGRTIAADLAGAERPTYAEAISPERFADGVDVVSGHGGWG